MKITVTGTGTSTPQVITATVGPVTSVNGKTGAVSITPGAIGADPAGAADSAVAGHVAAVDPHGDRAYADGAFLPLNHAGVTDWLNVKTYGATGDGTTDDTAAIQAALTACPPGGVVYLPAAVYRTSAPLNIPPFVTLQSAHGGGEAQSAGWSPPCSIKPLVTFSGVAAIQILDQQLGGYSRIASEIAIRNLTVDGSAVPTGTAVDGIRMTGQIQHVSLRDVQLRNMTGQGINTTYNFSAPPGPQAPFCLHWERVSVLWCKSFGIALNNTTDSFFQDVYVLGGSGTGWYIAGAGSSTWVGCRAEWSAGDGFQLVSGNGVQTFISCSTDRNANSGFSVPSSSNTGTVVLIGCRATRDGKASTTAGHAGLRVTSTTRKVIAEGLVVITGRDDDGTTGNLSPQYGVSVTGSTYVTVASGDLGAVSAGWNDGGGNTTLQLGTSVTGTGITTTKGDVLAATAAGAFTHLPVGPNNQVLTADSTQTAGLKWAAIPAGSTSAAGALQLDGTATDIQPLGTQAAGAVGKAADAGHVHPVTGVLPLAGGTMTGTITSAQAAPTSVALAGGVTGDAFDRVRILESGQIEMGSGTVTREVLIARSAANQLSVTAADFRIATVGRGLRVAEGANAKMGTLTLTGATAVVVSTTAVTATSRIFLTANAAGGTPGHFWVSTRVAGTNFSVVGTAGDTSTVAWMIVEPA